MSGDSSPALHGGLDQDDVLKGLVGSHGPIPVGLQRALQGRQHLQKGLNAGEVALMLKQPIQDTCSGHIV